MPLPIQAGSITNQLRDFFRLRGRTKFQLDETVVPIVLLKDLSPALGQIPASSSVTWSNPAAGGGQVALLLNPDAATLQLRLPELAFEGRSFTSGAMEIINRSSPVVLFDVSVHIVSRNNVLAPGPPTAIVQLTQTEENATGLRQVPVVLASFAAGGIAFAAQQLIYRNHIAAAVTFGDNFELPPFTIGPDEAVLITAATAAAASLFANIHGSYDPQPQ